MAEWSTGWNMSLASNTAVDVIFAVVSSAEAVWKA
jgi:hypothetical protein